MAGVRGDRMLSLNSGDSFVLKFDYCIKENCINKLCPVKSLSL